MNEQEINEFKLTVIEEQAKKELLESLARIKIEQEKINVILKCRDRLRAEL